MTAKLFKHGGSQAVRLPRQFRMSGKEVKITRTPHGVLLQPLDALEEEKRQQFIALAGSCPNLKDVPVHSTPNLPRDE